MAVLLSFSSLDETRISAARSRRSFGSLTCDGNYELRGCHASKSVFPFKYERVAAKQSLTSRLAAVRSRDVGRRAVPTTGGLGAPMFHPPTARLFHEPTWQPWSVPGLSHERVTPVAFTLEISAGACHARFQTILFHFERRKLGLHSLDLRIQGVDVRRLGAR